MSSVAYPPLDIHFYTSGVADVCCLPPLDKSSVRANKLDDVHFNPLICHWRLSKNELDYYYSSASLYENGVDNFGFMFDLYKEFDED